MNILTKRKVREAKNEKQKRHRDEEKALAAKRDEEKALAAKRDEEKAGLWNDIPSGNLEFFA
jgi:hypothetical protein